MYCTCANYTDIEKESSIAICSDSEAALKALQGTTNLIKETTLALKQLIELRFYVPFNTK